jgi:hypothetical protein
LFYRHFKGLYTATSPEKIPERLIKLYSYVKETQVRRNGTVHAVAKRLNRNLSYE